MPAWRHPYRHDAPSKILFEALEHSDEPLTQAQLATKANITISWTYKCLQRLMQDGYVREAGHVTFRLHGAKFGPMPKLYERTTKEFSEKTDQRPKAEKETPTAQDLADVMNSIIRRNFAAKRK